MSISLKGCMGSASLSSELDLCEWALQFPTTSLLLLDYFSQGSQVTGVQATPGNIPVSSEGFWGTELLTW